MKTKELFLSSFILLGLMLQNKCFVYYKGVADSQELNISKDRKFNTENWEAVSNTSHNSNTDLCYWKEEFYLIYQQSEYHLYSEKSRLILIKSNDCKKWIFVNEFIASDYELRDPKFAVINDKLFIYALPNREVSPAPFTTVYAFSYNGSEWTEFKEIDQQGWLFWRPKTFDNKYWYVTAYWNEHGKSALFRSTDGMKWESVSLIYQGEHCDEAAMEFTPKGEIFVTARLEGDLDWNGGSFTASTLIAKASYPFTEWTYNKTHTTRLDGPLLWRQDSLIFAAGRYEPDVNASQFGMGSVFNLKRTAIYLLVEDSLILLMILPSCGDTSYPGIAEKNGEIYISYYTNDPKIECTWSIGCFLPTKIMILKLATNDLESVTLFNCYNKNNLQTVNIDL